MPFLDFGDDPEELNFKFPDCEGCLHKRKPRTCRECDSGEFFEEQEPEGLDSIFRD